MMNKFKEGPPDQPQYSSMKYDSSNTGFLSLRMKAKFFSGTSMLGSGYTDMMCIMAMLSDCGCDPDNFEFQDLGPVQA